MCDTENIYIDNLELGVAGATPTLYSANDALTGDRVVTQADSTLSFQSNFSGRTTNIENSDNIIGCGEGGAIYSINSTNTIQSATFIGDATSCGGSANQANLSVQQIPIGGDQASIVSQLDGVYRNSIITVNNSGSDNSSFTQEDGTISMNSSTSHSVTAPQINLSTCTSSGNQLVSADSSGNVENSGIFLGANTNADSIQLGENSSNSNQDVISIGKNITNTALESILIGNNASISVSSGASVCIGYFSACPQQCVSIGYGSQATPISNASVCIGTNASIDGRASVALGTNSICSDEECIAVGSNSTATNQGDIAIGVNVTATNEINIGDEIRVTNGGQYTFTSLATASVDEYITVDTSGILNTHPVSSISYDELSSNVAATPTPAAVTLDEPLTIVRNNGTGLGTTWVVTLPNGTFNGQVKRLSIPRAGSTGAVNTQFTGQFANTNTNCTSNTSTQPNCVSLVWHAGNNDWELLDGKGITFS